MSAIAERLSQVTLDEPQLHHNLTVYALLAAGP